MKRKNLQGEFKVLPDAKSLLTVTCDVLTRQSEGRLEYSFGLTPKSNKDVQISHYISQREEI